MQRPALIEVNAAAIPPELRQQNRWAPWVAKWNAKRQKYDKTPVRADNLMGLSTAHPSRWFTFDAAMAAHQRAAGKTAGIGYVMTGADGVVGIDLDRAVRDGVVEPWAQEIIERTSGYAEISPSGNGVRIFVAGTLPSGSFTDHPAGVEVYDGSAPRFLTVTGAHLPGTPTKLVRAARGSLEWLAADHDKRGSTEATDKAAGPVPDLLTPEALPALGELALPPKVHAFLAEGTHQGDRSDALHAAAVALAGAGLTEQQVLSVLAHNPHAMEVALDHRRQDDERALDYLHQHHVQPAMKKAAGRVLTADDWDTPTTEDGKSERAETKDADLLPIKPAATWAHERVTLAYVVSRLLIRNGLCSCFGESGTGKSFAVLDVALHISNGREWCGRPVIKSQVLYIALEGANGVRLRLRALAEHKGLSLDGFHVLDTDWTLIDPANVRRLINTIRTLGPEVLVIVDTLAQATPGADENSSRDMGAVLHHCKQVISRTPATLLLVAHSGKDTSRGQRGWSGIKGALDVQLEVIRTATYRALTVTKMKDGPGERDEYQFDIEDVVLDLDDGKGQPVTAGVAVFKGGSQKATRQRDRKHGKNQRAVIDVLEDLSAAGDKEPYEAEVVRRTAERMEWAGRNRNTRAAETVDGLVQAGELTRIADNRLRHRFQAAPVGVDA